MPRYFVRELTAVICVVEFCSYLHDIADKAAKLAIGRWVDVLTAVILD